MTIGELARASGVTVRALYHYDELGLLRASERTASGHRRYTEADLRRCNRVRALRELGLSLEDIGRVLADATGHLTALRELLAARLRDLAVQTDHMGRLTRRVHGLLDQLDDGLPDPDEFMTMLERTISEMTSIYETYFTPEQRDQLAARRAELGPAAVDAAKAEWVELVVDLLRHVRADTPVADPVVRELVGRWDALGGRFTGGDDQARAAAGEMWRDHAEELSAKLPWSGDDMVALVGYLDRVRQAK
jgi:DNA-binding transcriptional MerR regulator